MALRDNFQLSFFVMIGEGPLPVAAVALDLGGVLVQVDHGRFCAGLAAAAPGLVDGVARVIMSAHKLSEIRMGEILVAPGTSAAWTVAFSFIKGLVTDGGGGLSHPVIMAREYGIPCVAGCLEGTSKIKTGQRIRVDGNRGVVFILDK